MVSDINIDLKPSTVKEHLIVVNQKIDMILESQADDRDAILKLFDEQKRYNDQMESRMKSVEGKQSAQCEAVDTLKNQVKGWNILNSLGVAIAAILAALGLKGS